MSKDQRALFFLETALFGKIFGHMCKGKICVSPHPPGVGCTEKTVCLSQEFFSSPPPPGHNETKGGQCLQNVPNGRGIQQLLATMIVANGVLQSALAPNQDSAVLWAQGGP